MAGELESAMLHACNAVDGTAEKVFPEEVSGRKRFAQFIRDNVDVIGPMSAPGVDLATSRFSVAVDKFRTTFNPPDFADLIYGVHRCTHGHGAELPNGFELIGDFASNSDSSHILVDVEHGTVMFSDRIVFGLVTASILATPNHEQSVPDGYFLTLDGHRFEIAEWWGQKTKWLEATRFAKRPLVTLNC